MVAKREQVIALSQLIAELRVQAAEARKRLVDAERELDALIGADDDDETVDATFGQQIVRMLDAHPEAFFDTDSLHKSLNAGGAGPNLPTLRTTLSRLVADGRIARAGRGRYCAVMPSGAGEEIAATARFLQGLNASPDVVVLPPPAHKHRNELPEWLTAARRAQREQINKTGSDLRAGSAQEGESANTEDKEVAP